MKLVRASEEIVNKLYTPYKLQKTLDEFLAMDCLIVKVELNDGEYASIRSAQSSYHGAVRRLGLPIKVRVLAGDLYLIKVDPDRV